MEVGELLDAAIQTLVLAGLSTTPLTAVFSLK
jgi:hypothetical protein